MFEKNGIELVTAQAESSDEIIRLGAQHDADGLLVQYGKITANVFEELADLDVVAVYGIGTDNVDVVAASEHGVPVLNVPTYCQDEVAEHALGLLISSERMIPRLDNSVKGGAWDWKIAAPVHRLSRSTLGVVGCGRIGTRLIELTRGFDFDVLGYDPHLDADEIAALGAEPVTFEQLLTRGEYITLHVPLTSDTKGMFDESAFQLMQRDAIIVNTSRGPVIDTTALHRALLNSEIRGAALDVFPEEPPEQSPLFDREDVVLTPHVAWYSEESIEVLRETAATDIARVLTGEFPDNVVNASKIRS